MDYWSEVMQDDVYVITQDGWPAGKTLRELINARGDAAKQKESPDLVIGRTKYKAELIPPALIVARFFRAEQAALDILQSEGDASSQVLEAYIEEHAVEDGLLADALTDSGKVSKVSVAARLKLATEIDEITALKQVKKLIETEAEHKKAVKDAQEKLDLLMFQQYPKLSIDDIKALIVDDKWLSTLQASIVAEIERVTQQLANRVKTLEERYAEPLSTIEDSVSALSEKVYAHLAAMGLQRNGELKVRSRE